MVGAAGEVVEEAHQRCGGIAGAPDDAHVVRDGGCATRLVVVTDAGPVVGAARVVLPRAGVRVQPAPRRGDWPAEGRVRGVDREDLEDRVGQAGEGLQLVVALRGGEAAHGDVVRPALDQGHRAAGRDGRAVEGDGRDAVAVLRDEVLNVELAGARCAGRCAGAGVRGGHVVLADRVVGGGVAGDLRLEVGVRTGAAGDGAEVDGRQGARSEGDIGVGAVPGE